MNTRKNCFSKPVGQASRLSTICTLLTLLTLLTLPAIPALAGIPDKGSFFVSMTDTNLSLTNVFYIPTPISTNLPVASVRAIPIADCTSLVLVADWVSTNAAGTTNNGAIRANVEVSHDGVLFTSTSNGVYFAMTTAGLTRQVSTTNLTAASLAGYEYMRLSNITTTNTGYWFLSNLVYRVVR
jgi:hypothetical protein